MSRPAQDRPHSNPTLSLESCRGQFYGASSSRGGGGGERSSGCPGQVRFSFRVETPPSLPAACSAEGFQGGTSLSEAQGGSRDYLGEAATQANPRGAWPRTARDATPSGSRPHFPHPPAGSGGTRGEGNPSQELAAGAERANPERAPLLEGKMQINNPARGRQELASFLANHRCRDIASYILRPIPSPEAFGTVSYFWV